jgi:hypothetical protein
VVIVVASFLLVILIYSTVVHDVFAKHVITTTACSVVDLGAGTRCCYSTYDINTAGSISNFHTYCQDCDRGGNNCGAEYEVRNTGTGVVAPGNLTNAPPSNNGKTTGVLNPPANLTNALPTNNNTGTIPPVSVIKVPPGTIGNATNPSSNTSTLKLSPLAGQQPQTQQTTGHHHKGSTVGKTGASTSTGNSTGR